LNGEFISALLRDFRQGGPKAIERVRRTQPAAYLKILALLMPREHKVEHRNLLKTMTDEELDAAIAAVREMLDQRAAAGGVVIEGAAETLALPAPSELERKGPNRVLDHADTSVGTRERKARKCKARKCKARKCKAPSPPGA
jgi:hypothetical protein